MSGQFYLDWGGLAISLFNMIILVWLGLTTLLNAERRTLGLTIASLMLFSGGAFFLIHTIILGYGADLFARGLNFWWQLGWIPVVILPYAWYGVMLWYAGFWDDRSAKLHIRHRPWIVVTTGLLLSILVMLTLANPLPDLAQLPQLNLASTPTILGVPLLILVYPIYLLICLFLSLNVLSHPTPTEKFMRDHARRRARPWLLAATSVQIIVSLLVGWVMLWVISSTHQQLPEDRLIISIAWYDLIIAALIALAVILVGQAIVSYEVFTGKGLPRRGLRVYWQRLLILSTGYSPLVALGISLPLQPVISLLLSTLLMVGFYGLLSWRAFSERKRYMDSLRPFVTTQKLYDHLLDTDEDTLGAVDLTASFQALCINLLGAKKAFLIPMGPLAALAGPTLVYPEGSKAELRANQEWLPESLTPEDLCISLDSGSNGNTQWAVPLWSERGLIGVLLLGEKEDQGLYTQEEIEIARAVAERLVDTQASANLARRLVSLQRQRLSEVRVLDEHTRRMLHDEVLPLLHTALLALDQDVPVKEKSLEAAQLALSDVHRQVADLLREMPRSVAPEVVKVGLVGAIRKRLEVEFKDAFDEVKFQVSPITEQRAREISPLNAEVLFYAAREVLRNAARHARIPESSKPLKLEIDIRWRDGIEISIADNGSGIKTVSETDSTGQGLALHSALLAVVGGSLSLESTKTDSTQVVITLPEDITRK